MLWFKQVLAFMLIASSIYAQQPFADFKNEIRIPVPPGWRIIGDTTDYPLVIAHDSKEGELLIFRSLMRNEGLITSGDALKKSVDQVIEEAVMPLPNAKIQTSSGFHEDNHVSFVIEFSSDDTLRQVVLQQRLTGVIYNHPSGHQILFTLWGKAQEDAPDEVKQNLYLMQKEFAYYGPSKGTVFEDGTATDAFWYWAAAAVLVVAAVIFVSRRRMRSEQIQFSDDSHFWRCTCGRLNHIDQTGCRRCGRPRQDTDVM